MKYYTFLDEDGKIIIQVKADSHDEAITEANLGTRIEIKHETDFYSEPYE